VSRARARNTLIAYVFGAPFWAVSVHEMVDYTAGFRCGTLIKHLH
jgi:hypothetical protein